MVELKEWNDGETNRESDRAPKKITCMECELLISKYCDDACESAELHLLKEHLSTCHTCGQVMAEYRELADLMVARVVTLSCPPAPAPRKQGILRLVTGAPARRFAVQAVGMAACILCFIAGHTLGFTQARRDGIPANSSVVVATPSMWLAQRPSSAANLENIGSEQPFTDGIGRYRAAIGSELRNGEVDWMRVRELVEAMGELRTDLELLTIHMAYLDIRTGSSPYEVADHWERLGSRADKGVYRQ